MRRKVEPKWKMNEFVRFRNLGRGDNWSQKSTLLLIRRHDKYGIADDVAWNG